MRGVRLLVVALVPTLLLSGCSSLFQQSIHDWVEPGLWEVASALPDDLEVPGYDETTVTRYNAFGLPSLPVPWAGYEDTTLRRLTVDVVQASDQLRVDLGRPAGQLYHEAGPGDVMVCLHGAELPMSEQAWTSAWQVLRERTDLESEPEGLRTYYVDPGAGGRPCGLVQANVTLEGLELGVVEPWVGSYHVKGDGYEAWLDTAGLYLRMRNPDDPVYRGSNSGDSHEPETVFHVDALDRVEMTRYYDASDDDVLTGDAVVRFVQDHFERIGFPPPADPSRITSTPYG